MTIHAEHPFADSSREAARQLRGRLGGRVTLLTAGEGRERAGWTVSSLAVVGGDPWRVVAFLDPDCDFVERVEQSGRAVLQLLDGGHQYLADAFAGTAPAPGGVFTLADWEQTAYGPRLAGAQNWATLELESATDLGWSRQLVLAVVEAGAGEDPAPLHHVRGRYRVLD
ncbi:flavin reductase family protein [Luteococcus peritonei]|uniref:Flavin reductase family protein n=1 Tax=Luteococcus peritonei TaxID=88874 RepID=A0ABW4RXN3_9ACTN